MKKWDSKKRDQNEKNIKHGWHAISFVKYALWSLNFKNHASYTIPAPQYFSNSILVQKFIFVILVFSWEERDRSPDSSGRKRKVSFTLI